MSTLKAFSEKERARVASLRQAAAFPRTGWQASRGLGGSLPTGIGGSFQWNPQPSYRSVTSILQQGLDQQPLAADEEPTTLPPHANVRGARYYH